MKDRKSEKTLSIAVVLLGTAAAVENLFYLLTGKMIPGLNPFTAALFLAMLWNVLHNRTIRYGKLCSVLFLLAILLNVIAGVSHILNAIS